ncbi:MAG: hypothetical protein R3192_10185 [Woeseiaceae bacterium]|nr:hypothetical protein [Woeseiaceae bacterium]
MKSMPQRGAVCTVAILGLLISTPSHAYLDPGTGSIILQGLLAGIAVAIGVVRGYWQQLKLFVDKLRGKSDNKKNDGDSDLDPTSDIPTN